MLGRSNWGNVSGNDFDWPYAPWNERRGQECKCCEGRGDWYRSFGGDIISKEEYENLDAEEQENYEYEYCRECDGNGII